MGNGPVRRAIRKWAARYRSFSAERFERFAKGGGNWPKLSALTIALRKRKKGDTRRTRDFKGRFAKKGAPIAMLMDTGILFGALNERFTRKPGQLQEDIPFGVRVGYGGQGRNKDGKITVARIAEIHQFGARIKVFGKWPARIPARPIIVDPNAKTIRLMGDDMQKALDQIAGVDKATLS